MPARRYERRIATSIQQAFPPDHTPTFRVRRITGAGELWTVEATGQDRSRDALLPRTVRSPAVAIAMGGVNVLLVAGRDRSRGYRSSPCLTPSAYTTSSWVIWSAGRPN